MKRLLTLSLLLAAIGPATGCYAPKALVCNAHLPALGAAVFRPLGYCWGCNLGCGEKYYHDACSPPPDCCEPCDGNGCYVGHENSWNYKGRGGPRMWYVNQRCASGGCGACGGVGDCAACGGCNSCDSCDSCGGCDSCQPCGGCSSCGGCADCGGGCDACAGGSTCGGGFGPRNNMAARGLEGKYGGQSGYWNDQDYFIGPRGHTEYWPRQKRYRGSEFSYGIAQATAYQYSSFTDREGNYHGGGYGNAVSYDDGYDGGGYDNDYYEGPISQPATTIPSTPQSAPRPAAEAPESSVEELPEPMSGLKWSPQRTKVSQSSSSAARRRPEPIPPQQSPVQRASHRAESAGTTLRIVQ